MKLFFENIKEQIRVPVEAPLEASLEQALDVFSSLPGNDGSSFGLVLSEKVPVQFLKYNKFIWQIEIPEKRRKGMFIALCSPARCRNFIKELFNGADPFDVCNFKYEPFF